MLEKNRLSVGDHLVGPKWTQCRHGVIMHSDHMDEEEALHPWPPHSKRNRRANLSLIQFSPRLGRQNVSSDQHSPLPSPRKQRYNNDSITDSFILGIGSISWEKRQ